MEEKTQKDYKLTIGQMQETRIKYAIEGTVHDKTTQELHQVIAMLEDKLSVFKWISPSQLMLEQDERVLIIPRETGIPVIGFISSVDCFWRGVFSDGIVGCHVDYWMPILETPK
jgi:hypothetical protein